MATEELQVLRVAEIREQPADEPHWLIEPLWGCGAVGVIGGSPKSCKTWLALEMAVAVSREIRRGPRPGDIIAGRRRPMFLPEPVGRRRRRR